MKLKEVMLRAEFESMYQCLIENYQRCRCVSREKMEQGFNQLRTINANENRDDLIIQIRVHKEDGVDYYDVSGYNPNEDIWYGIGYDEWENCVGYDVDTSLYEAMNHSEIAAHCFWEITWTGWTIEERQHNIEIGIKESNIVNELKSIGKEFINNNEMVHDIYMDRLIMEYKKAETDPLKTSIEIIVENIIKANLVLDSHIDKITMIFNDDDIDRAISIRKTVNT